MGGCVAGKIPLVDCLDRVRSGGEWIDPQLKHLPHRYADEQVTASLSPRERELVGLVRQGLRNREIAERLGITEGTVVPLPIADGCS